MFETKVVDLDKEEFYNLYFSQNITSMIQITEDEVGGTCSTHGGYKKCIQNFSRGTWKIPLKRQM